MNKVHPSSHAGTETSRRPARSMPISPFPLHRYFIYQRVPLPDFHQKCTTQLPNPD